MLHCRDGESSWQEEVRSTRSNAATGAAERLKLTAKLWRFWPEGAFQKGGGGGLSLYDGWTGEEERGLRGWASKEK